VRFLAALLLLACAPALAVCDWKHPGQNPYTGGRAEAIMRMSLPAATKAGLIWASTWQTYDRAVIWRDSITSTTGRLVYAPGLRDMAFGKSSVCGLADRTGWDEFQSEPASVYRSGNVCMVVPDVCGNPSWTTCEPDPMKARAVPEPGALWLVLAGLGAIIGVRRMRKCRGG